MLWRRSQKLAVDPVETERFLDLAGFVDGRLDNDERERVAALIAREPLAAADAAAARVLLGAKLTPASEAVVARAAALVGPPETRGEILRFPQQHMIRRPRFWPVAVRWGSLAAGIAVACWLGFDLGGDLPGIASIARSPDELGANELIDPAPLALRDASDGPSI